MTAKNYPITVEVGADFSQTFRWLQADGVTPKDLTSFTARLQVRLKHNSADPALLSVTNGSGITLGGVLGTIVVAFTAAQTVLLPQAENGVTNAVYDLELVSAGVVTRLVSGVCTIKSEVTR